MRRSAALLVAAFGLTQAKDFNCVPGQSCWPTSQQWKTFNQSIDGRLQVTVPLASSCYGSSPDYNAAQCKVVESNYTVSQYRSNMYGALETLAFEQCGTHQCQIDGLDPMKPPVQGQCELGSLSAYYVNATSTDHVQKTLAFVNAHSLRMSIKNTGHDYLGRSASPNSLALWTRHMRNISYAADFTAHNCPAANGKGIGIMGAGTQASEGVEFFDKYNRYITVGAVGSVGIVGGYGMGGGHGPLGPSVGLAVDQAVEFDVVTADGTFRTINQCNDPELFYAMRGGGGSTYAVLINYKSQTHPASNINLYTFTANVTEKTPANVTQSAVWPKLVNSLIENQVTWSNNHIAGYYFFFNTSISTLFIQPGNVNESTFKSLIAPFQNTVKALPHLSIGDDEFATFKSYIDFDDAVFGDGTSGSNSVAPVGVGQFGTTRLIPRTLFDAQTKRNDTSLKDVTLDGMSMAFANDMNVQMYATGPANQPNNTMTGVNPAWRGSLWGLYWAGIYPGGENDTKWMAQNDVAEKINANVEAITPGGGTYMNEASAFDDNWKQDFFGANYDRLLGIKNQYDPQNLFNCYKCVGWNGLNNTRYSCYTQNPQATVPMGAVS